MKKAQSSGRNQTHSVPGSRVGLARCPTAMLAASINRPANTSAPSIDIDNGSASPVRNIIPSCASALVVTEFNSPAIALSDQNSNAIGADADADATVGQDR